MPEISRFHGISVRMYYADHEPPHLHIRHAGRRAKFLITPAALVRGRVSTAVVALMESWIEAHRDALLEDWRRACLRLPLQPIPPLR